MAMNGTQLGNEIWAEISPYLEWDWENNIPPPAITGQEIWQKIGQKIVAHIQTNAKCSGADSHGDSHDNVGVV